MDDEILKNRKKRKFFPVKLHLRIWMSCYILRKTTLKNQKQVKETFRWKSSSEKEERRVQQMTDSAVFRLMDRYAEKSKKCRARKWLWPKCAP